MAQKTWFITGTSRGFGRIWAEAALERGDNVAGTARDTSTLAELGERYPDTFLAIELDVTDREADFAAIAQAAARFGRLDLIVNNAGYGHFGMIEAITEQEARAQFDANLFGALWVTQAALPILRTQGSGHIIQVSSIGGISAFADIGIYNASKWALEGFSQALAQEVADFGVHVTLVEPGGFATDWGGSSASASERIPAYDAVQQRRDHVREDAPKGDPAATAAAILRVVDAERPPLRVFFGTGPLSVATADYESRLKLWNDWQEVSELAQG